jgi:hypothetical protein
MLLCQPSATRPPFWNESPFRICTPKINMNSWLKVFDELAEMSAWFLHNVTITLIKSAIVRDNSAIARDAVWPSRRQLAPFLRHLTTNFNMDSWLTVLSSCLKCPHGLDTVIIILMKSTGLGQHDHHFDAICLLQPSATHPRFGQTCLFTNFPNILTIRCSEFKGIREKAGLSKMGVSCRRLVYCSENSTIAGPRNVV